MARVLADVDRRRRIEVLEAIPGDRVRHALGASLLDSRTFQDSAHAHAYRARLDARGLVFVRHGRPDVRVACTPDPLQGLADPSCRSALDGEGSVLPTRFDFTGLVTNSEDEGALPAHFARLPRSEVSISTASGRHVFWVWVADDNLARERGLMNVRALAPDAGMLFLFEAPHFASFWMKDTYVSLDLAFIDASGVVVNVARNAVPLSLEPIRSEAPVSRVLELVAGTADRIGLQPGDRVDYTNPALQKDR